MTPRRGLWRWRDRSEPESESEQVEPPEDEVDRRLTDAAANARVVAVSEELVGRVLRLRQAEAMIGELGDAIGRLRAASASVDSRTDAQREAGESAVRAEDGGDERPPRGGPVAQAASRLRSPGRGEVSEGLRLIVLQLASGGESREEIAARLEADFSVADAETVVAAVLETDGVQDAGPT